ncbi:hypothetical protein CYMTET_53687 [Cymbomonas tetramitiformis]|uniref:EF-hand domain-containing protein n=1 Tax=Cymbomonas tetramitiformis TaxID=36881 RepID=A0AAE0EPG9_9CHLO|nr:hypothetical protein CYMTET_53687 [Cymbomonas tetramitiformis]
MRKDNDLRLMSMDVDDMFGRTAVKRQPHQAIFRPSQFQPGSHRPRQAQPNNPLRVTPAKQSLELSQALRVAHCEAAPPSASLVNGSSPAPTPEDPSAPPPRDQGELRQYKLFKPGSLTHGIRISEHLMHASQLSHKGALNSESSGVVGKDAKESPQPENSQSAPLPPQRPNKGSEKRRLDPRVEDKIKGIWDELGCTKKGFLYEEELIVFCQHLRLTQQPELDDAEAFRLALATWQDLCAARRSQLPLRWTEFREFLVAAIAGWVKKSTPATLLTQLAGVQRMVRGDFQLVMQDMKRRATHRIQPSMSSPEGEGVFGMTRSASEHQLVEGVSSQLSLESFPAPNSPDSRPSTALDGRASPWGTPIGSRPSTPGLQPSRSMSAGLSSRADGSSQKLRRGGSVRKPAAYELELRRQLNPWSNFSPWTMRGGDGHDVRNGIIGLPQLLERMGVGVNHSPVKGEVDRMKAERSELISDQHLPTSPPGYLQMHWRI